MYRFDEVVFELPEGREETAETIEENFSDWWGFGSTDPEEEDITLEDRVAALEDMYLFGMM